MWPLRQCYVTSATMFFLRSATCGTAPGLECLRTFFSLRCLELLMMPLSLLALSTALGRCLCRAMRLTSAVSLKRSLSLSWYLCERSSRGRSRP